MQMRYQVNRRTIYPYLFLVVASCCVAVATNGSDLHRQRVDPSHQVESVESGAVPFDPLQQILNSFPKSVKFNEKRRLLEFCPDET